MTAIILFSFQMADISVHDAAKLVASLENIAVRLGVFYMFF